MPPLSVPRTRHIIAAALMACATTVAGAQSTTTTAAAAPAPPAPPRTERLVARTMLGDAAMVVRARIDGRVEIGAAGEGPVMDLMFPVGLVRLWVDSSRKLMRYTPHLRRRTDTVTVRSELEDLAVPAGVMSLSRRIARGGSDYTLFFSDTALNRVRVPISNEDARILVATLARAVDAVYALREPPPAPKPKPDSSRARPRKPAPPTPARTDTSARRHPGPSGA